jgi:tetratricopeptide (TPR) repeat protein
MIGIAPLLLAALGALAASPGDLASAEANYRSGRYDDALAAYESVLAHTKNPDPRLLYDAGNCAFRLKRYPEAALLYRRALRRAPRDAKARFNLLLTEQKLGMAPAPPEGFMASLARTAQAANASDLLWIAAALETAGLGILVIFRRRRGGPLAGALLLAGAAGAAALVAQKMWYPPPPEAIVLAAEAKVYAEPREDLTFIVKLPVGETVPIEEASDRWVKVRYRDREGWTPRAGIGIVD